MKNIFSDSFHIYKYGHNKDITFNNADSIDSHIFRSVEEGETIVNCQGKIIVAKKGDLIYIPTGRSADFEVSAKPACNGTVLKMCFLPDVDLLGYPPQIIKMDDEIKNLFYDIPILNPYEENVNSNIIWKTYKFLDSFQKRVIKYTDKQSVRLQKALQYMKENDCYTISEIAECCEISERWLRAAFNKILGTSPIEIKHRLQAVKADTLLKTTDLSVEEIANKVGYFSPNQLRNVMKKRYGALPKDIRKKP